jgi:hypothetical protein
MILIGAEFLLSQCAQGGFVAKLVLNDEGAIFFPANQQHRDQKAPGVSYADESVGNALAAMLSPGKIEIRNHRDFSEQRVGEIIETLLTMPELAILRTWRVTYRGRDIQSAT